MPTPQPRKRKAPASRTSRSKADTLRQALKRQLRAEREIPKLTRELHRAMDRSNTALDAVYQRLQHLKTVSPHASHTADELDAGLSAADKFQRGVSQNERGGHAKA